MLAARRYNFARVKKRSNCSTGPTLLCMIVEQRRFYHRCIYVYECINGLMDLPMELLANRNVHNYNTRNKDMLRLPLATKNWGEQRVCYHSLNDWNNLDKDIRNAPDAVNFKRIIISCFFYLTDFCIYCSFLSIFNLISLYIFISYNSLVYYF